MPDQLRDGRGRGYLAGVNSDNQLLTRATTVEQRLISTIDENYYEVTTGKITLTDAVETFLIYVKNDNNDFNVIFDRVFYDVWESTSGSGSGTLRYYRNPTIVGGTDIVPINTNFGSDKSITITAKKSLTSLTGTAWWTAQISPGSSVVLNEGRVIIPAGNSFAISVAAPASNTSMDVSINIAMFNLDSKLIQ